VILNEKEELKMETKVDTDREKNDNIIPIID